MLHKLARRIARFVHASSMYLFPTNHQPTPVLNVRIGRVGNGFHSFSFEHLEFRAAALQISLRRIFRLPVGRPSPGAPKGNKNAYKHGRYTAEAIARRREVFALIRAARSWLREL
jgi:hypothetical protein